MGFNFLRFTETKSSFAARVTLRRTGQLGFNSGAINSYQIKSYEFCVLYFDVAQRVVGIELTNESIEGTIPLKKGESNTYIRAKNFCDRYGIDYSKSHRYELKKDGATGYLYFELGADKAQGKAGKRGEPQEFNLE